MTAAAITIERVGRRAYFRGDTFAIKEQLRRAGAHWDADARAWWIGSAAKAAELAAELAQTVADKAADGDAQALTADTWILGKAIYKGRTYLLLWEGTTSRGPAMKLASLDGKRSFWAEPAACQVIKRYEAREYRGQMTRMTFGRLERLRAAYKASGGLSRVPYADPSARECLECGATYEAPGYVEQGQMGCTRCG